MKKVLSVEKRAAICHTLLLSSGKFGSEMAGTRGQSHALQGRKSLLPIHLTLAVNHRNLDVFQRRGPGQKIERLENKTNLCVTETRQLFVVILGHIFSIQPVAAPRGRIKTAKNFQQG